MILKFLSNKNDYMIVEYNTKLTQALTLFSCWILLFWDMSLGTFLWLQVSKLCLHVPSLKNLNVKTISPSPLDLVQ